MPTMSDKDFKRWRDRLRFAKDKWIERGLIGKKSSEMRMLIEFYRGNQWAHVLGMYGELEQDDQHTVNKIYPVANTMMANVSSRNPEVQVFPRNPPSIPMAVPVQHLVNYDIEELNMKRQSNKALLHHLFAPFGAIRHGFTPTEEYETESGRRMQLYRPSKPDRPFMRAIPIWNLLMDPTAETFHPDEGMRWVAFREIMRLADIQDNPNMISRSDLKDFAGNVSPAWGEIGAGILGETGDPDRESYVEVYTVYEAVERTWFQITLDGVDKPLRNPDDWPIPWETLPVSIFQANEQMDTPFPLPILSQAAGIQIEKNKLRTMMGQLVFRLRRLIAYQQGQIDESELTKIELAQINEMIATKGSPNEVLQMISSGVFPQELLQYDALLDEDLRESVGQGKMGRAQRINVETAHEASFVQRGDDINTGRIVEKFEEFNEDAIRLYMQGRRATMDVTGPEVVRIIGQKDADGIQQWATVDPEVLHGEFEFKVVHGSTQKKDREREAQKAAADLTIALQMQDIFKAAYFARKYLEARGISPDEGLTNEALVASAVREVDTIRRNAQIGEEKPAGGSIRPEVAALGGGGALQ
jgi:hypothetical protein